MRAVLSLADSPLCDAYLETKREQKFYPLTLNQCTQCGFVQINSVISPSFLLNEYLAKSQLNGTEEKPTYSREMLYIPHALESSSLKKHFQKYADDVCKNINLGSQDLVVDIGSNDGTLLQCFKEKSYRVLGVEPAIKIAKDATQRGIETLPEFFSLDFSKQIIKRYGHAALITINNVFANVDNLHDFTRGLENMLAPDGVLVIESSYLVDMVNNMVFDFIYHEHLSYFSIIPLVKFFNQFGLKLVKVEHVESKGGSLRYYWMKQSSGFVEDYSVSQFISAEEKTGINEDYFKRFGSRIGQARQELVEFLIQHEGKRIIGYGASATSTSLISHFGLNRYLTGLVDDNPQKIGMVSPGFHIPVTSSDILYKDSPDVIIILAWRFQEKIFKKISTLNCKIISPLPSFTVLK
jgi:hypothetical protein